MLGRYGTDNPFESDGIISGSECVGILEVDLMLPFCDFMMRSLNFKTHHFEGLNDFSTTPDPRIFRVNIKVTGNVIGFRFQIALFILLEEKKLTFGANIHRIAKLFGLRQNAL